MVGRDFLAVADQLARESTEAHWRTAVGRCYYALFLEGREALARWGFAPPARDRAHPFVRLRFLCAPDGDLKAFGRCLELLGTIRNRADYQLSTAPAFTAAFAQKRWPTPGRPSPCSTPLRPMRPG